MQRNDAAIASETSTPTHRVAALAISPVLKVQLEEQSDGDIMCCPGFSSTLGVQ